MELTMGSSVTFLSCLYLLVWTSPVSAKCQGKWAIHACFGDGPKRASNGKRSDPNMNSEPRIEPSLLRTLLITDAEKLSRMMQLPLGAVDQLAENDIAVPQSSVSLSPGQYEDDDFKEDNDDDSYPTQLSRNVPDVRDLRAYLLALKLQHELRKKEYLI